MKDTKGVRQVLEDRLINFMEGQEVYTHDGEGKLFLVDKADFISDLLNMIGGSDEI